jgi:hypothetical protein
MMRFIHESVLEYLSAEGLWEMVRTVPKERWAGDLARYVEPEQYASWGPVMRQMAELAAARDDCGQSALEALIDWCRDWRRNLFGLDCLPTVYAKLAADRPGTSDAASERLFEVVGDPDFITLKLEQSHLCGSVQADVRYARDAALRQFWPGVGHSTDCRHLPRLVQFSLMAFKTRKALFLLGKGVTELASVGRYREAIHRARLLVEGSPKAGYALYLMIAWIAASKAQESALTGAAGGPTSTLQTHREAAEQALAAALAIPRHQCFVPPGCAAVVLAVARSLLTLGCEPEALEVVERFGDLRDSAEEQRRQSACAHLVRLASEEGLDRGTRLRLLGRARALADRGRLSEHHEPFPSESEAEARYKEQMSLYRDRIAVALGYAAADQPEAVAELYGALLEEWLRGCGGGAWLAVLLEEWHRTCGAGAGVWLRGLGWEARAQIEALDLLLEGLEALPRAPWIAGWCHRLRTELDRFARSGSWKIGVWLARAQLISGQQDAAETILTAVFDQLKVGFVIAAEAAQEDSMLAGLAEWRSQEGERRNAIPSLAEVALRMRPPWQHTHLPGLARAAHEATQAHLDEWLEVRTCPEVFQLRGPAELEKSLRALSGDLTASLRSECRVLRALRESGHPDLHTAMEQLKASLSALAECEVKKLAEALRLRIALELYELGEAELSVDAVPADLGAITADDLFSDSPETMPLWDLPELRRRCPAFWAANPGVRAVVDALLATLTAANHQATAAARAEGHVAAGQVAEAAMVLEKELLFDAWCDVDSEARESFLALAAGLQSKAPERAFEAWRHASVFGRSAVEALIAEIRRSGTPIHPNLVAKLRRVLEERQSVDPDLLIALARLCLTSAPEDSSTLLSRALAEIRPDRWTPELGSELIEFIDSAQELAPDLAGRALDTAAGFAARDPASIWGLAAFLVEVGRRLARANRAVKAWSLLIDVYYRHVKTEFPEGAEDLAEAAEKAWSVEFDLEDSGEATRPSGLNESIFYLRCVEARVKALRELVRLGDPASYKDQVINLHEAIRRLWKTWPFGRPGLKASSRVLAELLEEVGERRAARGVLARLEALEPPAAQRPAPVSTAAEYAEIADTLPSGAEDEADRLLASIADKRGAEWVVARAKLLRVKCRNLEERRRQLAALLGRPDADALTAVDAILAELIRACDEPAVLAEVLDLCARGTV